MKKIHEDHQGIERCCRRVRSSVWWLGVSSQVTHMVRQCSECTKNSTKQYLPNMAFHRSYGEITGLRLAQFTNSYEYNRITSSPRFPQSNGQAECIVKTVADIIEVSRSLYGTSNCHTTPLPWCTLSPAELCMGRKLRKTIPQSDKHLIPPTSMYLQSGLT